MDFQVVGVIPVRWNSSRFPGKPLADLLGKSLLRRTYENARRSSSLDRLVVATDDQRIFKHVLEFGGEAFMTAEACPTGTDRICEVVKSHFPQAGIIVNIQGDEPCLDPFIIDTLVKHLNENPEAVVLTPVTKIEDPSHIFDPSSVKCVFDKSGKALYFSRAPIPFPQKADPNHAYYLHLGVYCFRREFLIRYTEMSSTPLQKMEDLEQLKILEMGYPIHIAIVQDSGMNVDTPEDLKKVEKFLCANISS